MTRTYVITGAASGIGAALAELLRGQGHTIIGVDLHDADVTADLTTHEGRDALVAEVTRLSGGTIDAVVANAGLATESVATVAVNYFGAIATLEGLRPLLAGSDAPRAVATASMASLFPVDDELVDACLAHDEKAALHRTQELLDAEQGALIYGSTKRALVRWIRQNAATSDWAGAGIPLNAVAPGVIRTPMTADLTATEEATKGLLEMVPMPLNGIAEPAAVSNLLAYLVSVENTHLCGQIVFVDGGSDVVIRGDSTF
ncbi:MAG: SDR family oxidoreductase [Microcella pacifica]|jgi:NAD(P)-dependent dehydrogenase (short-subunit alcohol dehydrogenase family)|uniref:SDR family oxidoreductase n=1 Tax=Microcella pacifica TaxID=2591847 RepID=A0A9E5JMN2_9MICO|nr:SDR family oxidoreductase [Microcella pacifica]NHF63389.1 SDR family oxidoreductase [Microcella pacifica]